MKLRAAATGFLLTVLVLAAVWTELPFHSPDSTWYLRLAARDGAEVLRPFALRVLHTGLAGLLARGSGLGLDTAFIAIAALAFWLLAGCTAWMHRRGGVPGLVTALVVVTWFGAALLRDATLPDVLNAGLIAASLAVLAVRPWWALVLLAVATLGRESTLLLTVIIGILSWREKRRAFGLVTVAAGVIGLVVADALAPGSSAHGFGGPLYLLAKAPFNLARNVLGCEFWVNTIPYCEPRWIWELPPRLQIGAVHSVGFCGFNPVRPLTLLVSWAGIFGVLPAVLWARRREASAVWRDAPLHLRAALVYGLALYALAPATGTMLPRLVGYAWPAFWLAVPLLVPLVAARRRDRWRLAAAHVGAAWGASLLRSTHPVEVPWLVAAGLVAVACQVVAARADNLEINIGKRMGL